MTGAPAGCALPRELADVAPVLNAEQLDGAPPPLRFAKHPERAGDLRPTRPAECLTSARSLSWLAGRLTHGGASRISRPLGGASRAPSSCPCAALDFACCTTLKAWLTSAFRQVTDWRSCQRIGSVSTAFASTNDGGSVLCGGTAMLTKSRSSTITRRPNHGP